MPRLVPDQQLRGLEPGGAATRAPDRVLAVNSSPTAGPGLHVRHLHRAGVSISLDPLEASLTPLSCRDPRTPPTGTALPSPPGQSHPHLLGRRVAGTSPSVPTPRSVSAKPLAPQSRWAPGTCEDAPRPVSQVPLSPLVPSEPWCTHHPCSSQASLQALCGRSFPFPVKFCVSHRIFLSPRKHSRCAGTRAGRDVLEDAGSRLEASGHVTPRLETALWHFSTRVLVPVQVASCYRCLSGAALPAAFCKSLCILSRPRPSFLSSPTPSAALFWWLLSVSVEAPSPPSATCVPSHVFLHGCPVITWDIACFPICPFGSG